MSIRVVHVISGLEASHGGPAAALRGLTLAQARMGMHVTVVASGDSIGTLEGCTGPTQALRVLTIGRSDGRMRRHPQTKVVLGDALSSAQVVHIHGLWEEIQHQAAVICRKLGKPYIFRPCGMLDPWSLSQGRWKKRLYMSWRLGRDLNRAAALHYTADAEREGASRLKLRPRPIVEPNGVDLEAYRDLPARGAFRTRFAIDAKVQLLLFLGRIHQIKGLDLLIPAFASTLASWSGDAKPVLVLAGPNRNEYRAVIERMISAHRIDENVIWAGMLQGQEKVQAYVDSDLFALPSYHENFGIVVAEAMAAGLPVIVSDRVNLDRDVLAAGAGAVVPMQVESIANVLREWLVESATRLAAGKAGREYAFRAFSWMAIAQRWQEHYARILEQ